MITKRLKNDQRPKEAKNDRKHCDSNICGHFVSFSDWGCYIGGVGTFYLSVPRGPLVQFVLEGPMCLLKQLTYDILCEPGLKQLFYRNKHTGKVG